MNQTKVEQNLLADAQAQYSFVQHKQPSTAFKNIVCSTHTVCILGSTDLTT
jgi:hypothetical protein